MIIRVILYSIGSNAGPLFDLYYSPGGVVPFANNVPGALLMGGGQIYTVPDGTEKIIIKSVQANGYDPGLCADYELDVIPLGFTTTTTTTGGVVPPSPTTTTTTTSGGIPPTTTTTTSSSTSSTTTTTTTSGGTPPTTTTTTTGGQPEPPTTTTSTTIECPSCYYYDLYCDGVEGQSSVFDIVECDGTIIEQSVPYEVSPMTFCLQSDPVIRPLGVSGHFVKGEICGNVCDTTTTTTTIPCATIESYLGYHDTSPIDACSASTLSYWGDVSVFADCTILYRDQFCTLLAYEGYYSDGLISRYWTGTEFSGLDTSCLDICYEYDLYCDGVEGQSSLFSYRDCTGQYEEQTVPFEASPWTLCSTVLPQSIGAVSGHIMGGSIPCTTTTTTTIS